MSDISFNAAYRDRAILKEIGDFIKAKRLDMNLTQHEVAERAAMSRSTLSLVWCGKYSSESNLVW